MPEPQSQENTIAQPPVPDGGGVATVTVDSDPVRPTPEMEQKRTQERREREVSILTKTLLNSERRKRLGGTDGKERTPQTDQEVALVLYDRFRTGEHFTWKDQQEGNPILLSETPLYANKSRLVSVDSTTTDGRFNCKVKDAATNKEVAVILERDEVAAAQLLSERDIYENIFQGDEQKLLKAQLDSLPQNRDPRKPDEVMALPADIDTAIESTASNRGVLRISEITQSALFQAMKPEDQQRIRDRMGDSILVGKREFRGMIIDAGMGRGQIATQMETAVDSAAKLQERLSRLTQDTPEYNQTKKQLEEQRAQITLLSQVDALWKQTKPDETPLDSFFDKAERGDAEAGEVVKILDAVGNDDATPLVELFPGLRETSDMTDEQKTELRAKRKQVGAFLNDHKGEIAAGVLTPFGLIILIIGAVGMVVLQAGAKSFANQ